MNLPDRLEKALARLSAAIHHLQAAAESRAQADALQVDLDEEFLVLQDDRSRLAVELDGALARSRALLAANHEVAARLDRAGASVQAIVGRLDPGPVRGRPAGADPAEAAHAEPPARSDEEPRSCPRSR